MAMNFDSNSSSDSSDDKHANIKIKEVMERVKAHRRDPMLETFSAQLQLQFETSSSSQSTPSQSSKAGRQETASDEHLEEALHEGPQTLPVDAMRAVPTPASSLKAAFVTYQAPPAAEPLIDPVEDPYSHVLLNIGTNPVMHLEKKCKPCAFLKAETGCMQGKSCRYCHFLHNRLRLGRPARIVRLHCKHMVETLLAAPESEERQMSLQILSDESPYMRGLLQIGGRQIEDDDEKPK